MLPNSLDWMAEKNWTGFFDYCSHSSMKLETYFNRTQLRILDSQNLTPRHSTSLVDVWTQKFRPGKKIRTRYSYLSKIPHTQPLFKKKEKALLKLFQDRSEVEDCME